MSDADLTEFLRSAKLASRNKRDTEVVAMLDEVVNLARSAVQDDNNAEEYRRESRRFSSMPPEEKEDCSSLPYPETLQKSCEETNKLVSQVNKGHHDKAIHSAEVAQKP